MPFLREHIAFDDERQRWVEPFLGAGSVLFNINPARAVGADSNPHIIRFYLALQRGEFSPEEAADTLRAESVLLRRKGEAHFYAVRDRFNETPSSLDFLFLDHTCFNGLIRFNRSGEFNSPFCRNPNRLTNSLIVDISKRLATVQRSLRERDWVFICHP